MSLCLLFQREVSEFGKARGLSQEDLRRKAQSLVDKYRDEIDEMEKEFPGALDLYGALDRIATGVTIGGLRS